MYLVLILSYYFLVSTRMRKKEEKEDKSRLSRRARVLD